MSIMYKELHRKHDINIACYSSIVSESLTNVNEMFIQKLKSLNLHLRD